MSDEIKPIKKTVVIYVYVSPEGNIRPLKIKWDDEQYSVDKINSILPAASFKASDFGMKYSCRINGEKLTYIKNKRGHGLFIQTLLNELPRYYADVVDYTLCPLGECATTGCIKPDDVKCSKCRYHIRPLIIMMQKRARINSSFFIYLWNIIKYYVNIC